MDGPDTVQPAVQLPDSNDEALEGEPDIFNDAIIQIEDDERDQPDLRIWTQVGPNWTNETNWIKRINNTKISWTIKMNRSTWNRMLRTKQLEVGIGREAQPPPISVEQGRCTHQRWTPSTHPLDLHYLTYPAVLIRPTPCSKHRIGHLTNHHAQWHKNEHR